jgi:hypothetical protein
MPEDLVVAATLGRRDLQVLVVFNEKLCRAPVRNVGAFDRALLKPECRYRFWLPESFPPDDIKECRVDACWKERQLQFDQRLDCRLATAKDLGVAVNGDEPDLWLIPGLLWRYLLELKQELQEGKVTLRRFLLLYTDRDKATRWAADEPRAAALLLHDWLQSWLPGVCQGVIEALPYLTGIEDVYVQDQTNSKFLRPAVTTRIDQKLWEGGAFRGSKVRLHDAGGIPAVSDMLRSLARFRFGPDNVQYRLPVESDEQPERLSASLTTAVENLEARRRVCDLVRRGEFQAAKGLADEFARSADRVDARWVRCVSAVARYFQGYMTDASAQAGQLPGTKTGIKLQEVLAAHWPKSYHVAMRAEAALIAQDILAAATLTVTFLDVALLDAIDATLRIDPDQPCVEWSSREINFSRFRPTKSELRSCARAIGTAGREWLRSVTEADLDAWLRWPDLRAERLWQEHTLSRVIRDVGNRRDLAQALDALLDGLRKPTNNGNVPADFRNIIIHSLPTDEEIRRMVDVFASRSLWYRASGDQPMAFLGRSTLPAAVLTALGVGHARQLYEQLIDRLIGDIEACPFSAEHDR